MRKITIATPITRCWSPVCNSTFKELTDFHGGRGCLETLVHYSAPLILPDTDMLSNDEMVKDLAVEINFWDGTLTFIKIFISLKTYALKSKYAIEDSGDQIVLGDFNHSWYLVETITAVALEEALYEAINSLQLLTMNKCV